MDDVNAVVPGSRQEDYEGKVIVIRRDALIAPWSDGDRRLYCTGGFGSKPYLSGQAVFGVLFADPKDNGRWQRPQIEGVAADQTIPETVKAELAKS